jgi:cell division transport system ATP-binding protein
MRELSSQGSGPPYIAYEDVEVRFSNYVRGLRGFTLSVAKGEFVFLVGRTGSGKSTALKLLYRDVRETSGRVVLDGRRLSSIRDREVPALRRRMGIVPQDFALLPRKRVWENVGYAMRAIGATRRQVRERVPEILEQVGIGHRADAFPHELSGGEQQRVALARALINRPALMIADEPTGNLDPEVSFEIMDLLARLNDSGTTVLVASHDLMVVESMNRRIVVLEEGRVVADSVPRLVPERAFAFLSEEAHGAPPIQTQEARAEPADGADSVADPPPAAAGHESREAGGMVIGSGGALRLSSRMPQPDLGGVGLARAARRRTGDGRDSGEGGNQADD